MKIHVFFTPTSIKTYLGCVCLLLASCAHHNNLVSWPQREAVERLPVFTGFGKAPPDKALVWFLRPAKDVNDWFPRLSLDGVHIVDLLNGTCVGALVEPGRKVLLQDSTLEAKGMKDVSRSMTVELKAGETHFVMVRVFGGEILGAHPVLLPGTVVMVQDRAKFVDEMSVVDAETAGRQARGCRVVSSGFRFQDLR